MHLNICKTSFEICRQSPIRRNDQQNHHRCRAIFRWTFDGISQLFTGVVTIAGTLAFMLSINVKISLIVIFITPLSLFVASFVAKRRITCLKYSLKRGHR